jgi:hypothetical protein
MTIGVLSKTSILMSSTVGHSVGKACFRGALRICLRFQESLPESFLRRTGLFVKRLLGISIRQSALIEWRKNHLTSCSLCAACLSVSCTPRYRPASRRESILSKHFAVALIVVHFRSLKQEGRRLCGASRAQRVCRLKKTLSIGSLTLFAVMRFHVLLMINDNISFSNSVPLYTGMLCKALGSL